MVLYRLKQNCINAALSNITAVYYVGGLCLQNNKKAAISG